MCNIDIIGSGVSGNTDGRKIYSGSNRETAVAAAAVTTLLIIAKAIQQ